MTLHLQTISSISLCQAAGGWASNLRGLMKINFILTAFSPAMFGEKATVHVRAISLDQAREYVDGSTKIMATRVTHDRLAKVLFPKADPDATRYANLRPGTAAIHLLYRGPPIPDSGEVPLTGSVTPYLIEVEEYQDD